jgi:hypothetical protein
LRCDIHRSCTIPVVNNQNLRAQSSCAQVVR